MIRLLASVLSGLLLAGSAASAMPANRREQVQFRKGETGTTLKGRIKGDQIVDYRLRAAAGQSIVVAFRPSNPSAYFNVIAPGADSALFVGSTSGNEFSAELPTDGVYTLRVYLMRHAARRNETADYALQVRVVGQADKTVGPHRSREAAQ